MRYVTPVDREPAHFEYVWMQIDLGVDGLCPLYYTAMMKENNFTAVQQTATAVPILLY